MAGKRIQVMIVVENSRFEEFTIGWVSETSYKRASNSGNGMKFYKGESGEQEVQSNEGYSQSVSYGSIAILKKSDPTIKLRIDDLKEKIKFLEELYKTGEAPMDPTSLKEAEAIVAAAAAIKGGKKADATMILAKLIQNRG